jgi:hypothetical protein
MVSFSYSQVWLVLDCPKNNTPSSKIPLRKNLEVAFMGNLANFAMTQVQGGK